MLWLGGTICVLQVPICFGRDTANMFSNPRFMSGAGSTCSADVFCFAAAQTKKALELTVKLGGKGYVFWGGGYVPCFHYGDGHLCAWSD